ncbi:N-acetylmuramoyl-L-alanine amidase [Paracoccus aerodenitrificans]|uniref:N-acetylmuramoyl-L-alanine amidase n=1 Tax=Paracoccus aerodenitrificans TaxID=3017781 RepID=UPI0022EFF5FB|nr:N-acetylmuramoyl-L-alanine amidase [Paracoccus aerodenitrificans]WBU62902.1 N-acetylmuramoyl-L-alanine amidase [Paracoccus aerodenitrificans]
MTPDPSRSHPSPNHGPRRDGAIPSLIVIHFTGMADAASARARLCDQQAEVSAHWLIDEDGSVEALVPEERRAWHAGAGAWQGQEDINSRSIGIELVNPGNRPFAAAQMDALETLLAGIMARWSIGRQAVIGHSDMAPGRKFDPGPRFDWARLARQGLAVHPDGPGEDRPLTESLAAIGYPEADAVERLHAFRLRFRPRATGPEDATDRRIAAAAAAAFAKAM